MGSGAAGNNSGISADVGERCRGCVRDAALILSQAGTPGTPGTPRLCLLDRNSRPRRPGLARDCVPPVRVFRRGGVQQPEGPLAGSRYTRFAQGSSMHEAHWRVALDVISARALVWVARFRRDADLTPEAHLFFGDRYHRLAEHHRRSGRPPRACRFEVLAQHHLNQGGFDDSPLAAAMAIPRPVNFVRTDAVSRIRLDPPDDAA